MSHGRYHRASEPPVHNEECKSTRNEVVVDIIQQYEEATIYLLIKGTINNRS